MSDRTTSVPLRHTVSPEQMAQHEGLVRWVVRQQHLGNLSFPDALHEGRIGLWKALQHFDPFHGTAFSTYAVPAIRHAVWHAVSSSNSALQAASPPAPSPADDPLDLLVQQLFTTQLNKCLLCLVQALPPRLQSIVVAHYGLDPSSPPRSFAQIARSLGVSRQRVHYLNLQALAHLAHPDHSLPLRRLLGRLSRSDYQHALSRQRHLARARRAYPRRSSPR